MSENTTEKRISDFKFNRGMIMAGITTVAAGILLLTAHKDKGVELQQPNAHKGWGVVITAAGILAVAAGVKGKRDVLFSLEELEAEQKALSIEANEHEADDFQQAEELDLDNLAVVKDTAVGGLMTYNSQGRHGFLYNAATDIAHVPTVKQLNSNALNTIKKGMS